MAQYGPNVLVPKVRNHNLLHFGPVKGSPEQTPRGGDSGPLNLHRKSEWHWRCFMDNRDLGHVEACFFELLEVNEFYHSLASSVIFDHSMYIFPKVAVSAARLGCVLLTHLLWKKTLGSTFGWKFEPFGIAWWGQTKAPHIFWWYPKSLMPVKEYLLIFLGIPQSQPMNLNYLTIVKLGHLPITMTTEVWIQFGMT